MKNSILSHQPDDVKELRPAQNVALLSFESNINEKYHIMQLPTGSGKSIIGITIGSYSGSAFYSTHQKSLQDQLLQSPGGYLVGVYKGRQNYTCSKIDPATNTFHNCKTGKDAGGGEPCDFCPYSIAKREAFDHPIVGLNHDQLLTSLKYKVWDEDVIKDILIVDEAHNFPNKLCDYFATKIFSSTVRDLGVNWINEKLKDERGDKKKFSILLTWVVEELLPKIEFYVEGLLLRKREKEEIGDKAEVSRIEKKMDIMNNLLQACEEVIELDISEYSISCNYRELVLKPVSPSKIFVENIAPKFTKIIFMSATFGGVGEFAKDLGIEEYNRLVVETDFPHHNRPVYIIDNAPKVSGQTLEAGIKYAVDMSYEIAMDIQYINEKGIIHTVNNNIRDAVTNNFKKKCPERNIYTVGVRDSEKSRDEIIQDFIEDDTPAILVSPSSMEGLDLYDKLCRFCIFCKMPYQSLADPWVKYRMNHEDGWYARQTRIMVLQGLGRGVRSKTDWCHTFILDSNFQRLFDIDNIVDSVVDNNLSTTELSFIEENLDLFSSLRFINKYEDTYTDSYVDFAKCLGY